jgi:hypothetical protein
MKSLDDAQSPLLEGFSEKTFTRLRSAKSNMSESIASSRSRVFTDSHLPCGVFTDTP